LRDDLLLAMYGEFRAKRSDTGYIILGFIIPFLLLALVR